MDKIEENPDIGQIEDALSHLGKGHRRVLQDYFKIIYYTEGDVLRITDIFDTRQNPKKMQG